MFKFEGGLALFSSRSNSDSGRGSGSNFGRDSGRGSSGGSGRVWFNASLPQTLHMVQVLLYVRGVVDLLRLLTLGFSVIGIFNASAVALLLLLSQTPGQIIAAYGIANEKKWGFYLGLIASAVPLLFILGAAFYTRDFNVLRGNPIGLILAAALLGLLLHPRSINEVREW